MITLYEAMENLSKSPYLAKKAEIFKTVLTKIYFGAKIY